MLLLVCDDVSCQLIVTERTKLLKGTAESLDG
jgi:hypothetical protein